MGDIELLDLLKGMVGELGLGCRKNDNGTITIFEFSKATVAVTLSTQKSHKLPNPAMVVAYRGIFKLSNFLRAYDLHDATDYEHMRSMILQASGRPKQIALDIEDERAEAEMCISHYLECHIVVRPDKPEDTEFMQPLMKARGWWMSTLTVDESNEEKAGDLIFTTRESDSDIIIIREKMLSALKFLSDNKTQIKRYKIEAAILDSKKSDHLFRLVQAKT